MLLFRSPANRKTIEDHAQAGRLCRLAHGIYSSDTHTDPAHQIRQNLVGVLAYLRPRAIISHRSALLPEFGAESGFVTMTDPRLTQNSRHQIPGLDILVTPGPPPTPYDRDLSPTLGQGPGVLYVASPRRAVLENLEPRRVVRTVGQSLILPVDDVQAFLAAHLPTAEDINRFRQSMVLESAAADAWSREQGRADGLLQRLRQRQAATAWCVSPAVDPRRVVLFENLAQQLMRGVHGNETLWGERLPDFPNRPREDDRRFLHLAFYESYFSNDIEGTRFAPQEAYAIALGPESAQATGKAAHDIRALYSLYADPELFLSEDRTAEAFIANLKAWHAIFGAHSEKEAILPGRFKNVPNYAGSTEFVDPAQVEGTLRAAWAIGESLTEPFDKAVFRAATTVEIHPFIDGNGRITRLAASSVLARAGKMRFMIPSVFQEDYILAQRAFSLGNPIPIIRMFRRATTITASVPFDRPFEELTSWLGERHAFASPHETRWQEEMK